MRGSATRSGSAPLRVLAAMSGGVDSAVAAARAQEAGHDVVGVHLALSAKPATMREGARGCCSVEDSRDARRCADVLDVPFYVWDMADRFREDVIEPFVAEYAAGRTPNPCLRCNEKIKFSAVLDRARALGFDAVATGHYARLTDGVLRRAADPDKDQSYVLGVLTADQLAHAMFPLGDSLKSEVRAEAARRGLVVAEKPDSHDICFIPSGDTRGFLSDRVPDAPGELVDAMSGAVLGSHDGVQNFTVGQRHGLGLSRPAPDGRPRYVLGIEPVSRQVRVGPVEALEVTALTTEAPVWHGGTGRFDDVTVQVRAHGGLAPAAVEVHDDGLAVTLGAPLRGVAPGQAVVVYDDDRVLGSATIAATS